MFNDALILKRLGLILSFFIGPMFSHCLLSSFVPDTRTLVNPSQIVFVWHLVNSDESVNQSVIWEGTYSITACARIHTHKHSQVLAHAHTHTHIHTHMCTHTHTHTHTHEYTNTHTHTHTHTQTRYGNRNILVV
jgi:hypothetical protein